MWLACLYIYIAFALKPRAKRCAIALRTRYKLKVNTLASHASHGNLCYGEPQYIPVILFIQHSNANTQRMWCFFKSKAREILVL